jgi:hypothetical protein
VVAVRLKSNLQQCCNKAVAAVLFAVCVCRLLPPIKVALMISSVREEAQGRTTIFDGCNRIASISCSENSWMNFSELA